MRRSLASLFFLIAAVGLGVAAVSWWLDQTVFNPQASRSIAEAVLSDDDIRRQVSTLIAQSAADSIGVEVPELRAQVNRLSQTSPGAEVLEQVVADGHAKLIGLREEPVQITAAQIVPLVSDERAGDLPPVTVPVQEVGALSVLRESIGWIMVTTAGIGAVALVLGLLAHPARSEAVFGIGALLGSLGVMAILIGYVVPVALVPALSDHTWVGAIPALARANATFTFGAAIVAIVLSLTLMIGSSLSRRRRSWTSPVNMARYRDVQSWS